MAPDSGFRDAICDAPQSGSSNPKIEPEQKPGKNHPTPTADRYTRLPPTAYRGQVTDSEYSGIFTFEGDWAHLKKKYGNFVEDLGLTFHHALSSEDADG